MQTVKKSATPRRRQTPPTASPLPDKPPATPAQVRLWVAWADAVRAAEAAEAALRRYAALADSDPDAPPTKSYELSPRQRQRGAAHAAYALRMSLERDVDHDTPAEVEYLLGRKDGVRADAVAEFCRAEVRGRVERRFGALLPAREDA